MDPLTAGLVAGGVGSAFGFMSNKDNVEAQREANAANIAMAREQMQFQERMSNSAHQREMADMQRAGLNPILAAKYGGASSPSGASGSIQAPRSETASIVRDSINSGFSAANLAADLDIKNANVANTLADTLNKVEARPGITATSALSEATKEAKTHQATYEATRAHSEAARSKHEAKRAHLASKAEEADLPRAMEQSRQDKDFQRYDNVIKRIESGIGAATSALNVSKYLRSPTVQPGTRAEKRALESAGRKGLRVK